MNMQQQSMFRASPKLSAYKYEKVSSWGGAKLFHGWSTEGCANACSLACLKCSHAPDLHCWCAGLMRLHRFINLDISWLFNILHDFNTFPIDSFDIFLKCWTATFASHVYWPNSFTAGSYVPSRTTCTRFHAVPMQISRIKLSRMSQCRVGGKMQFTSGTVCSLACVLARESASCVKRSMV